MRVLVFGATGSIGFPVAQALARAGHIVYGQTRSKDNVKQLLLSDIIPVIGEVDSAVWHGLAPTIDAVVDALTGMQFQQSPKIFSTILSLRSETSKLVYIYTSGITLSGDTDNLDNFVSESSDPLNVMPNSLPSKFGLEMLLNARRANDKLFLECKDQRVISVVIRPGLVYGGPKSAVSTLLDEAVSTHQVRWPKKELNQAFRQRFNAVHADDLADLYVRAIEKAPVVQGRVVIGSANSGSMDDFLKRVAELVKAEKGVEYYEAKTPLDEALSGSQIVHPYLGRTLLGWTPTKPGLVESTRAVLLAYLAGKSGAEYEGLVDELLAGVL